MTLLWRRWDVLGRRGPCESSMVKKAYRFFASGDSFVPEKNGVVATKLDDFNPFSFSSWIFLFFATFSIFSDQFWTFCTCLSSLVYFREVAVVLEHFCSFQHFCLFCNYSFLLIWTVILVFFADWQALLDLFWQFPVDFRVIASS